MHKRKELILTLSLVVILCITILHGVAVFLAWGQDIVDNIAGLFAFALVTPVLIGCFLEAILVEISVYFNLRYFLLCESKSRRRTVCNILMLVAAGVAMVFGAVGSLWKTPFKHAAISLCTGGFVLMMILRVVDLVFMHTEKSRGMAECR